MVVELLRLSNTAMVITTALFMDLFRLCNWQRWCSWHYCPSYVVHCPLIDAVYGGLIHSKHAHATVQSQVLAVHVSGILVKKGLKK